MEREECFPKDAASLRAEEDSWVGFLRSQDDKTRGEMLELVDAFVAMDQGARNRLRMTAKVMRRRPHPRGYDAELARAVFEAATQGGREDLARALGMSLADFEAAIA